MRLRRARARRATASPSSAAKLLEVLAEHPGQLAGLASYASGSLQVERGSSSFESTPGHGDGHPEAEELVRPVLDVRELARDRGAEQRPRRRDRHPLPLAVRPARPAGVDEPHLRAVLVELLASIRAYTDRRLRQERRAEAGGEGRLRLGDADLRAGELRRVAGEEAVHRLVAGQPRDRRQDPERVRGEEDRPSRMPGVLRRQRVRDLLELVRRARVLGLRVVVEVDDAALVEDDVLEHRPERVRRPEISGSASAESRITFA